jgi:hypothetical protein
LADLKQEINDLKAEVKQLREPAAKAPPEERLKPFVLTPPEKLPPPALTVPARP